MYHAVGVSDVRISGFDMLRILVFCLVVAVPVSCDATAGKAELAGKAFIAFIDEERYDLAYTLLSPEMVRKIGFPEFVAEFSMLREKLGKNFKRHEMEPSPQALSIAQSGEWEGLTVRIYPDASKIAESIVVEAAGRNYRIVDFKVADAHSESVFGAEFEPIADKSLSEFKIQLEGRMLNYNGGDDYLIARRIGYQVPPSYEAMNRSVLTQLLTQGTIAGLGQSPFLERLKQARIHSVEYAGEAANAVEGTVVLYSFQIEYKQSELPGMMILKYKNDVLSRVGLYGFKLPQGMKFWVFPRSQ
jgi:RNA polymerase subunit RPABC4/transcription elongation factor Spt4